MEDTIFFSIRASKEEVEGVQSSCSPLPKFRRKFNICCSHWSRNEGHCLWWRWGHDVSLNDETSALAWIPSSAHKCGPVWQAVLVGVL